jgi:hypothetical protein
MSGSKSGVSAETLRSISTPDRVESRRGSGLGRGYLMTTDSSAGQRPRRDDSRTRPSALSAKSGQARHQRVRPGVLTDAMVSTTT